MPRSRAAQPLHTYFITFGQPETAGGTDAYSVMYPDLDTLVAAEATRGDWEYAIDDEGVFVWDWDEKKMYEVRKPEPTFNLEEVAS